MNEDEFYEKRIIKRYIVGGGGGPNSDPARHPQAHDWAWTASDEREVYEDLESSGYFLREDGDKDRQEFLEYIEFLEQLEEDES